MLTYQICTSIPLLATSRLFFGITRWPAKNPKEAKKAKRDLSDFIIRKLPTEFILVNGLELVNGLAAKLLRCFHALTLQVRPY